MFNKFLFFCLGFLFFLGLPSLVFASTLSLSPSSGTIQIGVVKPVQVILNGGGDSVNAVSAFLSYPQDKLEVTSVRAGSAFAIEAENSFGGGIIKISRGSLSPVSGSKAVATINFKGKAEGKATVAFIGGSQAPRAADSTDSLNLGGSRGGTFDVTKAAPRPTKTPGQEETGEGIVITGLKAVPTSSNSATIYWKTNKEADSTVEYGVDQGQYFMTVIDNKLTVDHKVDINNPLFLPGTLFHYKVISKDSTGSIASSDDQILRLPGYKIKVKLTDQKGKPIKNTRVTLYSYPMEGMTNETGDVLFEDVMEGKHLLVIRPEKDGKPAGEKSFEVEVKPLFPLETVQDINLKVDISTFSQKDLFGLNNYLSSPAIFIILTLEAIVLLVIFFFITKLIRKKKKNKISESDSFDVKL